MENVKPPVPDPKVQPKTSGEMAAEGDREGPVLPDGTHENEIDTERAGTDADPQFARNGE